MPEEGLDPGATPESAALNVMSHFAAAQDDLTKAFQRHVEEGLVAPVAKFVLSRVRRLSDDEIRDMAIVMAQAGGMRLHPGAFRSTYVRTKTLRDRIAHRGPSFAIHDPETDEHGMMWFGGTAPEPFQVSLSELRDTARDAMWLGQVGHMVLWTTILEGDPDHVSASAEIPPTSLTGFVDGEDSLRPAGCPRCQGDLRAATSTYGRAWKCTECIWIGVEAMPSEGA